MGLYIKDLDLSEGCGAHTLKVWPDGQVEVFDEDGEWYVATAVPVPDHGRLVALPFSVGTEIWSAEPFKDRKPRRAKVTVFEVDDDGAYGFWCSFNPEPMSAEFLVEDIGKTVFFSCEEAEKALEGMELVLCGEEIT